MPRSYERNAVASPLLPRMNECLGIGRGPTVASRGLMHPSRVTVWSLYRDRGGRSCSGRWDL
jgi:hypothetical protein